MDTRIPLGILDCVFIMHCGKQHTNLQGVLQMSEPTTQDYAAFLESLKVKQYEPEHMDGLPFDEPIHVLPDVSQLAGSIIGCIQDLKSIGETDGADLLEYLLERCLRLESNAKPSDLAEQVKAFMRTGMDAQSKSDNAMEKEGQHYWDEVSDEFRRLSEPE